MTAYVISLKPAIDLTDEQYYALCGNNPDQKFERNAKGDLVIMSPTGGVTGNRNFSLIVQFGNWVAQDGTGIGFDSSTGFRLPNGADRSPDVAWVKLNRWNTLTATQQEKFPPIAPDFVVEIRSKTDELAPLQAKMNEYCSNGVRLGLLLNSKDQQVEVYRSGQAVVVLSQPSQVDCNPELPGFVLSLSGIL
jgi:Uma2 family endonuclease